MNRQPSTSGSLASTEQLLVDGGDARLALDPTDKRNKYGCQPFPDPLLLSFSSSTASVISTEGFAVADRLRQALLSEIGKDSPADVYARHMRRIRLQWLELYGVSDAPGLELVFSPSGTDVHGLVACYMASAALLPPLIVMVDANETGSGVAMALSGDNTVEVAQVAIRLADGTPRPASDIDAEAEKLIAGAATANRRVLLILVDQSKTGLIAPSPACAMALQRRYPEHVEVLVDACQFRIAASTLRRYLEQDFMVALTGSKFLGGPSFSATLLLPAATVQRLQQRPFPNGLLARTSKADWPEHWPGREQLTDSTNFGLLLRCVVALDELRRFRAAPETAVMDFLPAFAEAIHRRLMADPHFEPLPTPLLDRSPLIAEPGWDQYPTIFPFLLYAPQAARRVLLNRDQTLRIYRQLPVALDTPNSALGSIRCQLGQPVACGSRNGTAIGALRLCLSSRLLADAAASADQGRGIIENALKVLDKTALLIDMEHG